MYGAIIGDIAGSRFEFDRGPWTKDFELFTNECDWTDDSAMTIAIADALMSVSKDATDDEIHEAVIEKMRYWGRKYPGAGYGGRFYHWLFSCEEPKPYNSWGNGSAMRVSPVGFMYDTLERTLEVAKLTAEVTHNHPEGIKGAQCTAAVIFLARTGKTKAEIKEYVETEFGYDINHTVDELRPLHRMDESCMDALPKALISFLEATDFEDAIRNAVSLGGDTDTIAAIAGSMAEAFFGIPSNIKEEASNYLTNDMMKVIKNFEKETIT